MASTSATLVRGACPHDCPDTCATLVEVKDGRAVRFSADPDHPITPRLALRQGPPLSRPGLRPRPARVSAAAEGTRGERPMGTHLLGRGDRGDYRSLEKRSSPSMGRPRFCRTRTAARSVSCSSMSAMPASGTGWGPVVWSARSVARRRRPRSTPRSAHVCRRTRATSGTASSSSSGATTRRAPAHTSCHSCAKPNATAPHVVCIDPRRTLTARSADEHVQPRPATDAALALGLMHVIFAEGLHDEPWLQAHTLGWEDLRERAAAYPPARVAELTGLHEDQIVALARRYGTTKPAALKFADGVQRHGNGGQTARARSLACQRSLAKSVFAAAGCFTRRAATSPGTRRRLDTPRSAHRRRGSSI